MKSFALPHIRWNRNIWFGAMSALVIFWVLWAGWWSPRRAFVQDLQSGMRAYMMGDMTRARESLIAASIQKPEDASTRHLLAKVAVEDSLRRLRSGDRAGAVERLQAVLSQLSPNDPSASELIRLKNQIERSGGLRHRDVPAMLTDLMAVPESPAVKPEWTREMETSRELLVKTISENQRLWMESFEKERALWRRYVMEGVAILLLIGLGIAAFMTLLVRQAFGRKGWVAQMLEEHTQRLLSASMGGVGLALPPGPGSELRKIEFIEAELVRPEDHELAKAALRSYLEMNDPWIRARAAKAFHKLDAEAALATIRTLLEDTSSQCQLSGIWALGELGTSESVELLSRLAWNKDAEVQKAVLRVLVQMEHQQKLSPSAQKQVKALLEELREKTGWII